MTALKHDGKTSVPNATLLPIKKADNRRQILGVRVSSAPLEEVLTKIANFVTSSLKSGPKVVVTVNQEFVMQAWDDAEFKNILNSADLAIADGQGLRLAAPDLQVTPGRVVVQALAENKDYKKYYLGGAPGVAEAMVAKYGGRGEYGHSDIQASWADAKASANIIKNINAYQPDIVLVAYGAPWQEKWMWANKDKIHTKVIMGVGGSFDYLVGRAVIPPEWINQLGLEWLWRLLHEPWRWRRQLNLLRFVGLVLLGK